MKTSKVDSLENFSGTVLVPVIETKTNDTVTIEFDGLTYRLKCFTGKKDSYYLAVNGSKTYVFIGLGKTIDYKSLKTIFRRIAVKEKSYIRKSSSFEYSRRIWGRSSRSGSFGIIVGDLQSRSF